MTTADDLTELNRDIWTPFVQSYAALDAEIFTSLHAPTLARGGSFTGGHDEYVAASRDFFAKATAQGDAFTIDFRFTERLAAGGLATEQGYFKLTVTLAGAAPRDQYGRFQVLSRRGDDTWQIIGDYDDPAGSPSLYSSAHPMDELEPFLSGS